jgi:hypothetical protein
MTLMLIDCRTVYSPRFSGVFWDVQDVALDDIDRIEVARGPEGTLWGAVAGHAADTPVGPVPGRLNIRGAQRIRVTSSRASPPKGVTCSSDSIFPDARRACRRRDGPSLRDVDWLYGSTDAQIFSAGSIACELSLATMLRLTTRTSTRALISERTTSFRLRRSRRTPRGRW